MSLSNYVKIKYVFKEKHLHVSIKIGSQIECVSVSNTYFLCVSVTGGVCTLRLRRPLFCCCCCSMSSMAEAGGEAALMALTTLMLSSGSGGRFRRSRPRTFISWSSSKPPKVNCKIRIGDRNTVIHRFVYSKLRRVRRSRKMYFHQPKINSRSFEDSPYVLSVSFVGTKIK